MVMQRVMPEESVAEVEEECPVLEGLNSQRSELIQQIEDLMTERATCECRMTRMALNDQLRELRV